LGGVGLVIPVQFLLVLNGSVFGISGFLHDAVRGGKEALTSVAGFLLGGAIVGAMEGVAPPTVPTGLFRIVYSGLLVGIGTKMSSGCTSGHMVCGLSRFSSRSIVATATFFATSVVTARFVYKGSLPPVRTTDWTLGMHGNTFLALQGVSIAISTLLYLLSSGTASTAIDVPKQAEPRSIFRLLVNLTTGFNFAIALRLSNLSEPVRVISFLLLPFDSAFDPSLAYLAVGTLPLASLLYHFGRSKEQPRFGGQWAVPKGGKIDSKLVLGAAIFGVGWGLVGICPGPGLVNLGRALGSGSGIQQTAAWVGSVALGGLLV